MARQTVKWKVETDGVKLYTTGSNPTELTHFLAFDVPSGDPELGYEEIGEWNNANIYYRTEDGIESKVRRN